MLISKFVNGQHQFKKSSRLQQSESYALGNNVKDLPVIFDRPNVVSVNRDNHYHDDVHLKKEQDK